MSATLSGEQLAALFLVLLRSTGFVVAAPILGYRALPLAARAGLAAVLAVAVAPLAREGQGALPLLLAAPLELGIGLVLGYLLALTFHALEMIGRLLSLQMGLSLGSVLSPTQGEASTPLDPLFAVLAGLLFLALDLHLALVRVLAGSFAAFPLGGGWPPEVAPAGVALSAAALELGVRVAMPLALVLLLADLAVGMLARAVPQINVFLLGLPIKILVGLAVTAAALPALARGSAELYGFFFRSVAGVTP